MKKLGEQYAQLDTTARSIGPPHNAHTLSIEATALHQRAIGMEPRFCFSFESFVNKQSRIYSYPWSQILLRGSAFRGADLRGRKAFTVVTNRSVLLYAPFQSCIFNCSNIQ